MNQFLNELKWRGFLHSSTQGVEEHLAKGNVTGYIGFDPTAASLHVGSLLPIMGLVHLQRCGHTPIAVAGGGTGMVGDPSGKTQERKFLSRDELDENLIGIKKQLLHFLDFKSKINPAVLINNAEWLIELSFMGFLRDVGKHFSVNEMLAKDSVKSRLDQEHGMSFTEFSYSLLQAYDFLELYDRYKCTLQMGGSDQWGNIVSGIDLVRRLRGGEAHGIVFPLITTSAGVKFGKTESGTVWLDLNLTSPYKFYQFWYNSDDRDVIQYLKFFTFLPEHEIQELEMKVRTQPQNREAQTSLASTVTDMVHGKDATDKALNASSILFGGEIKDVDEDDLLEIFGDVPSTNMAKDQFGGDGALMVDVLVKAGVVPSKSEARRSMLSGGIYVNNLRVTDITKRVNVHDAIKGRFLVLRKGAKNYSLVRIV